MVLRTLGVGMLVVGVLAAAVLPSDQPATAAPAPLRAAAVVQPVSPDDRPVANLAGDMIPVPGVEPMVAPERMARGTLGAIAQTTHLVWIAVTSATSTTSDDKNTLTIAGVTAMVTAMDEFWSEQSGGRVRVELGGIETINLGRSSCSPSSVASAVASTYDGADFASSAWVGTNNHLLVLTRESCGGASGFGTVGGNGGTIFSSYGSGSSLGIPVALHEFGHNLGFLHAGSAVCLNSDSYDAQLANFAYNATAGCAVSEYGDFLDIMGYTVDSSTPQLGSVQRIAAGYLTDYTVAQDGLGTVTLAALGSGRPGTPALLVTDPVSGDDYVLEYRIALGADASSPEFWAATSCTSAGSGYSSCSFDSTSSGAVRITRLLPVARFGANASFVQAVSEMTDGVPERRRVHLVAGDRFTSASDGISISVDSVDPYLGAVLSVRVGDAEPTSTSLMLPELSTQVYGSPSPLQVAAQIDLETGSPAGTVRFSAEGRTVGYTGVDGSGLATVTAPSTLPAGTHLVTARFVPESPAYATSTSAPVTVVVTKASSTSSARLKSTRIRKSTSPVVRVTVAVPGVSAPTGTLYVYSGTRKIKTYSLSSSKLGVASITLPRFSTTGTKSISVRYVGNSNILGSVSSVTRLRVVS